MQDFDYQKQVMERILQIWGKHNHLRLCQLIANAAGNDIFYLSDEKLLDLLETFDKSYQP